MIKTINISCLPSITNIEREQTRVQNMLYDILCVRNPSENNTNTYEFCRTALECFCYVPAKFSVWVGRYARYLNFDDPLKVVLKPGGFVVSDNGYTVTLTSNGRVFRVRKQPQRWFMMMTQNDKLKILMNNI